MDNTYKTKFTSDLDQYFVDDEEKEYGLAHNKDFTQKMINKYLNVFIGIG